MKQEYLTITALTKYIKYKFDNDVHLQDVLVEGEISNFKHHSSGHFYFTLKDKDASITAMMFSSSAKNVKFQVKDGMKVFVKGNITVYEKSGNYQIVCKELKSDGVGDLYLAYEQLKKELEEKGLFDSKHKKLIPLYPNTIGIITAPTGAAIQDVINTIKRRFPVCTLIIYPALVQGDGAKSSVASQIKKANMDNLCDTLIVGRGGGSIEDLWAFNEIEVINAIFESNIPIISAIGHEVDFTISDFVSDIRAATPTAAAEIATPSIDVLIQNISLNDRRLNTAINNLFNDYKLSLMNLDKRLDNNNPEEKLKTQKIRLEDLTKKLNHLAKSVLNDKFHEYTLLNEKLRLLSPLNIMEKGYSIAKKENVFIRSINDVNIDDEINIQVKDGNIKTRVMEVTDVKR